jgi:succinate dehydrogenase / fumarate reductase flavoprotein subunit
MHGSNRLGGNSLSDLLVFGRRAGLGASDYVRSLSDRPKPPQDAVEEATKMALAPYDAHENPENPYTLHAELQQSMNDLVGIIRKADELEQALLALQELRGRVAKVSVEGGRRFNQGWHIELDLHNMLVVSECVAKAALERTESRGGHTRDDHPAMEAEWRKVNLICSLAGGAADLTAETVEVARQPLSPMRPDLLALFEWSELSKYMTADELEGLPGGPQSVGLPADSPAAAEGA